MVLLTQILRLGDEQVKRKEKKVGLGNGLGFLLTLSRQMAASGFMEGQHLREFWMSFAVQLALLSAPLSLEKKWVKEIK